MCHFPVELVQYNEIVVSTVDADCHHSVSSHTFQVFIAPICFQVSMGLILTDGIMHADDLAREVLGHRQASYWIKLHAPHG